MQSWKVVSELARGWISSSSDATVRLKVTSKGDFLLCEQTKRSILLGLPDDSTAGTGATTTGSSAKSNLMKAERVGEQQLADVLGNLPPFPQRLDPRDGTCLPPSHRRRTWRSSPRSRRRPSSAGPSPRISTPCFTRALDVFECCRSDRTATRRLLDSVGFRGAARSKLRLSASYPGAILRALFMARLRLRLLLGPFGFTMPKH